MAVETGRTRPSSPIWSASRADVIPSDRSVISSRQSAARRTSDRCVLDQADGGALRIHFRRVKREHGGVPSMCKVALTDTGPS